MSLMKCENDQYLGVKMFLYWSLSTFTDANRDIGTTMSSMLKILSEFLLRDENYSIQKGQYMIIFLKILTFK